MKVLHVITTVSRDSGGPARSSQGLVAALCAVGVEARILTLDGSEPWLPGAVKAELSDLSAGELRKWDLVHIHGLWRPPLHRVAEACRQAGVPYVLAPRGMLEPWSLRQKWLKKRIARFLYQDRDLKLAAALHATAESEAEQFRRLGFGNRIIVSPNGVNVPEGDFRTQPRRASRRALFVSRMHPKKGVLELVEAWASLRQSNDRTADQWTCELVYTVNGDAERSYEQKVRARVRELGLEQNFVFTGALDDEKKWAAYARADLFALPTYSENFGIVVAEALWAGLPVIATKGTPWAELEERQCGWWIDIGVEPLAKALKTAMALTEEARREMGERGRSLVEEKYTWKAVGAEMKQAYLSLKYKV